MSELFFRTWNLPNTLIGYAALAFSGVADRQQSRPGRHYVITPGSGMDSILRRANKTAIALGEVVLYRAAHFTPRRARHEVVHVRQYRTLGMFFLPAYAAASLVAAAQGKRPYRDNYFERKAREAE